MDVRLSLHSFSTQLVLGVVALILLTTVSAGVPAFWLTHAALERQAWRHVESAQRATHSLFQAEQAQLADVAILLSERPTLRRLLLQGELADLDPYLSDFQRQSGLDFVRLCRADGQPLAGSSVLPDCLSSLPANVQLLAQHPAMLAWQGVLDADSGQELGRVVVGRWLDAGFLAQMASDTGVDQTILLADGRWAVTTLPTDRPHAFTSTGPDQGVLTVGEMDYYVSAFPLGDPQAAAPLQAQVALPAGDLLSTQSWAQWILVISTSAVAVVGVAAAIWVVGRLTTPLQKLTRVAEKISQGELDTPIPTLPGPPEIATLTTALQSSQARMLAALADLAQARDWLDALVQSIAEGVVAFDAAGQVTFLNQTAAALTPFSGEEALGRHLNDLFQVASEGTVSFMDLLPAQGAKTQVILQRPGEDGRAPRPAARPGQRSPRRLGLNVGSTPEVMLEVTGTRLPGREGAGAQTVLVLRDVTEAEALRYLRSYFLSNITHEFRTPLSTLSACMDLLLEGADSLTPPEIRELIRPVQLSLLGLRTLIDNLLDSSTIEAGRFGIRSRPLDLEQVIAAGLQMVQPLLERRDQAVALSTPGPLPPVQGDGARLTQVLVNLLTNASKYSPMGRRNLDEVVRTGLQAVGLWEEVKDRLRTPATSLSVGQQQRLCLARTLAVEPEILLCDESTASLDPLSARGIEDLLRSLRDRYTVILVTHDIDQARRLADYVIFMWMGELVEAGPAAKFFEHPAQELTQAYLAREVG